MAIPKLSRSTPAPRPPHEIIEASFVATAPSPSARWNYRRSCCITAIVLRQEQLHELLAQPGRVEDRLADAVRDLLVREGYDVTETRGGR